MSKTLDDQGKKNVHQGHRQRLRNLVTKSGLNGMPEHQVLEYMLSFVVPQKDTNVIAHKLIDKFGSIAGVLEANQASLAETDGIGEVVAHFLANFRNMFSYYQTSKVKDVAVIHNSREAYIYLQAYLKYQLTEMVYILGLDTKSNLVFTERLSTGSANRTDASIRKITELVVHHKVHNIIVAHNHPNGICVPSVEDDEFTKSLLCAMTINDVHVLDHIIVNNTDFYSYFANHRFIEFNNEFRSFLNSHDVAQTRADYDV